MVPTLVPFSTIMTTVSNLSTCDLSTVLTNVGEIVVPDATYLNADIAHDFNFHTTGDPLFDLVPDATYVNTDVAHDLNVNAATVDPFDPVAVRTSNAHDTVDPVAACALSYSTTFSFDRFQRDPFAIVMTHVLGCINDTCLWTDNEPAFFLDTACAINQLHQHKTSTWQHMHPNPDTGLHFKHILWDYQTTPLVSDIHWWSLRYNTPWIRFNNNLHIMQNQMLTDDCNSECQIIQAVNITGDPIDIMINMSPHSVTAVSRIVEKHIWIGAIKWLEALSQKNQPHEDLMPVNLHHGQNLINVQDETEISLTHVRQLELVQILLWFQISYVHADCHNHASIIPPCFQFIKNMVDSSYTKSAYLSCPESRTHVGENAEPFGTSPIIQDGTVQAVLHHLKPAAITPVPLPNATQAIGSIKRWKSSTSWMLNHDTKVETNQGAFNNNSQLLPRYEHGLSITTVIGKELEIVHNLIHESWQHSHVTKYCSCVRMLYNSMYCGDHPISHKDSPFHASSYYEKFDEGSTARFVANGLLTLDPGGEECVGIISNPRRDAQGDAFMTLLLNAVNLLSNIVNEDYQLSISMFQDGPNMNFNAQCCKSIMSMINAVCMTNLCASDNLPMQLMTIHARNCSFLCKVHDHWLHADSKVNHDTKSVMIWITLGKKVKVRHPLIIVSCIILVEHAQYSDIVFKHHEFPIHPEKQENYHLQSQGEHISNHPKLSTLFIMLRPVMTIMVTKGAIKIILECSRIVQRSLLLIRGVLERPQG